uniref:Lactoylglutathione lyase n=2 Tax=Physcomitrium patens TaxID=3218 RepID=A0A7I4CY43_PHYPA
MVAASPLMRRSCRQAYLMISSAPRLAICSSSARLPPSSLLGCAIPHANGGNGNQKCTRRRLHLIQASSKSPVEIVQRRLINFLALAGASFSFLPMDLLAGTGIPGVIGSTQVSQSRDSGTQASAALAASTTHEENILQFVKNDNRRMLHVVYRVGDIDKTIKFYTECLGMKVLRRRDIPEDKYTNAFLGYGPEETNFAVELTYNYGVDKYDIGTGFGHFGIAVDDVQKVCDLVKAKGGKVTREPGPVKGGNSIIAFVEDSDGYSFELIQRTAKIEPFCQVMLRVGDLDRAVQFYKKAFGMKELSRRDNPEQMYTLAKLGYGDDEMKTTVLELTYNYGITEYTKGDGYGQIAIGTNDVYKTAEAVKLFGGEIVREPGPLPGLNTKITAILDPDGWKSVFVDNADFAKELE